MSKAFYWIFMVATLVVAIIFSTLNFSSVSLHYLWGRVEAPLSVLLVCAFIVGFAVGLLLDAWILRRQAARIRKLEKQIKVYDSEVSNLRKLPLKDFSE